MPLPRLPTEGMGSFHGNRYLGDEEGAISDTLLTRTAMARPKIMYKDLEMTVEVYGISGQLLINMLCPKCGQSLSIPQAKKHIVWDKDKGLFTDPCQCTWEVQMRAGERMEFGLNLCRFAFAFDGWRLKEC